MRKLHPLVVVGLLGILITLFFHFFLSLSAGEEMDHPVFYGVYPVFASFILIGLGVKLLKKRLKSIS